MQYLRLHTCLFYFINLLTSFMRLDAIIPPACGYIGFPPGRLGIGQTQENNSEVKFALGQGVKLD
jgi:hypothetical protein